MKIITLLFSFLPLCILFAQVPDTIWTKTYGDSSYDVLSGIVRVNDGFIITGSLGKQIAPNVYSTRIWLLRIDDNGNEVWNRTYDGMGAGSIFRMSENEFIVSASTFTQGSWENMMLMKINDLGDTIWTRTYVFPNSEYIQSMKISDDNSIMVLGYAYPYGTIMMKVLNSGDTSWTKFYPDIQGTDFEFSDDGGFILMYIKMNSVYISRLDSAGSILSDKNIIDYSYWVSANEIIKTADGGYLASGSIQPAADTSYIWIHKYDSDLNEVFQKTNKDFYFARVSKVIQYGSEDFLVAGSFGPYFSEDGLLVKINAAGDIVWSSTYGGEGDDIFVNVYPALNNGVIVSGFTSLNPDNKHDGWILRFGPETAAGTEILSAIPDEFYLGQNYPNPFNPATTIKYYVPETATINITVYDILGNKISQLVKETKNSGVYEVKFDAAELASGIYLYKLQTDNFVKTRKMIILR